MKKLFLLSCIGLLSSCASAPQNGETTPGLDPLFQEFSKCRTDIFQHVARNHAQYASLGPLAPLENRGEWFAMKPVGDTSGELIYRFEKPLKVNGVTIVAAAYDFFKGDNIGYSGGDSLYWGFYFAENAKTVQTALRGKYPSVAAMLNIRGDLVNLSVTDKDGKRTEAGAILSDDSSKPYAKSYFSCTVQIKLLNKK